MTDQERNEIAKEVALALIANSSSKDLLWTKNEKALIATSAFDIAYKLQELAIKHSTET